MITENISTLKIHKLTQEQYDRELEAGRIDETALYLTPDDGVAVDNTLSVTGMAADAKTTGDAIGEAKSIATNALNKANNAQPALGFIPVQQGLADGKGNNKIRLAWNPYDEAKSGLQINVDGTNTGNVITDNPLFGGVAPIANGGTGATNQIDARCNLNGTSGYPQHMALNYLYPNDTNIISGNVSTEAFMEWFDNNCSITFTHNIDAIHLTDIPFAYGVVTLNKGVNNDFRTGFAIDIGHGDAYFYKYNGINVADNGWKRIFTNILTVNDYGTSLPSSGVTGQIYHVKG